MFNKLFFKNIKILTPKNTYEAVYCQCEITESLNFSNLKDSLTPAEYNILNKIKGEKKINNFLVGRYISKLAVIKLLKLNHPLTISIEKGIFNFPIVKTNSNQNLQVSITYSNNHFAAIAFFEECPMAIDIETVSQKKISSISRSLNFPINYPDDFNHDAFIISQWTCIEALGKALKIGISLPFSFYEPNETKIIKKELITTFKFLYPFKCSTFYKDNLVITFSYPSNCTLLHNFI